jgi:hypothetical protein
MVSILVPNTFLHPRQSEWRDPLARTVLVPAMRRRVSARNAIVGDVLSPFGPRPVPLIVLGEGVGEPAWSNADEGRTVHARRWGRWLSSAPTRIGASERAPGDRGPLVAPSAALRGEGPYREQANEDQNGDPRAVPVVHNNSVRPVASGRSPTPLVCQEPPMPT